MLNDTAMVLVCIPTGALYGVLILNMHADWVQSGRASEIERKALELAEREQRRKEREELLRWAESLPDEPEAPRTYARQKTEEPEQEPGVTTEWEEVKYQ
jgi:hypothetical protein